MKSSDSRSPWGEHDLPLPSLVFATLGAPLAWVLHLSVSYFLVTLGCNTGWGGTDLALGLVTLLLAAVAAAAGAFSHRKWRRLRPAGSWLASLEEPRGRSSLFLLVGMSAAALFLLLILLSGLPPLFVPTCT